MSLYHPGGRLPLVSPPGGHPSPYVSHDPCFHSGFPAPLSAKDFPAREVQDPEWGQETVSGLDSKPTVVNLRHQFILSFIQPVFSWYLPCAGHCSGHGERSSEQSRDICPASWSVCSSGERGQCLECVNEVESTVSQRWSSAGQTNKARGEDRKSWRGCR